MHDDKPLLEEVENSRRGQKVLNPTGDSRRYG
jgi:hypothetical protein